MSLLNETENASPSKPPATCVKFTPDEYERIQKEHTKRNVSIPSLLKDAYFGRAPTAILMTQDEQKNWIRELNQIGNNVNQIARKVNAGFRSGFEVDLASISSHLSRLVTLVTSKLIANR